jgi:2-polyprenyl-6-methoxyphenol hydroxylase-like FAD-dependent oxidoreductase
MQDMYERPRQQENAAMMTALDSLKRVFEPQDGLLANLRGLGLDLINGSGVIKRQIMKYAMGIA